tara:strand:+ start:340 stop:681 length:342 start_codon:yes stop_codon:yes gene_type:complete
MLIAALETWDWIFPETSGRNIFLRGTLLHGGLQTYSKFDQGDCRNRFPGFLGREFGPAGEAAKIGHFSLPFKEGVSSFTLTDILHTGSISGIQRKGMVFTEGFQIRPKTTSCP